MSEILVSKERALRGILFFNLRLKKGLHEGISRLPNYHTFFSRTSYVTFLVHLMLPTYTKVRATNSIENKIK